MRVVRACGPPKQASGPGRHGEPGWTRLWLALALALALAAIAYAQGLIPTCPRLAVQVISSKGKVSQGDKALLTVNVLHTGAAALDGVNVGLSSSLVASWRSSLKQESALVFGNSVYSLDQDLRPGKRESYQIKARMCSDAELGPQLIASAMVYRLNATGGVACMTIVDSNSVSPVGRSVQFIECWQPLLMRTQATFD